MGFKCGIVGLPNVGKSTLFNALTRRRRRRRPTIRSAPSSRTSATSPCPTPARQAGGHRGLAGHHPDALTFVDIAGLVRGASKGEGLGNQFLANIREVDAIAHVLRCFEDGDITHVEARSIRCRRRVVETELMLADLDSLEKRRVGVEKKAKGGDKEAKELA
jgi:ribosome-binding ATPase YchF (GTP1/OBG family)